MRRSDGRGIVSISLLRACLLIASLAAAGLALAQVSPQALDVLRRNIVAEGAVNLSGIRSVVVFENGTKVQGYQQQVYEKAPGKLHMSVIAPEDLKGRLCVSNGLVQWQYLPGKCRATRHDLPPAAPARAQRLAGLEDLSQRMRIDYLGTETIAGRSAHVVCVLTRGGSPLKKSWIDAEHYVALKMQRFDTEGRVKLSMYYTAINFQPQFTAGMFDFTPPAGCSVRAASDLPERVPLAEAEGRAGFAAVLPGYRPAGYSFQDQNVAVIPLKGKKALWLIFSNGADTFSLFQRSRGVQLPPREYGRSMDWSAGAYSFAIVGQLSCNEMRKVRDSIRPPAAH